MVSTRRAAPDEPSLIEQPDNLPPAVKSERSPSAEASSPQKRKDAPTDEEGDSKRRQVSPPGENGYTIATIKEEQPTEVTEETESNTQEATNAPSRPEIAPEDLAELNLVSRQLLKTITHTSFEYLTQIVSRTESRKGKAYKALYDRFKAVRLKLPTDGNFVETAHGEGPLGDDAFVRRINTVTFANSMVGIRDASFRQLNEHFYKTFVGKSGTVLQQHAEILLGLKTQAYISQAVDKGGVRHDVLSDLFASDAGAKILALRPESPDPTLTAPEQAFVTELSRRRKSLSEKTVPSTIRVLKDRYRWNEVLTNMLKYIKEHLQELAGAPIDSIQSLNDDGESPVDIVELPGSGLHGAGKPKIPTNGPQRTTQSAAQPQQQQIGSDGSNSNSQKSHSAIAQASSAGRTENTSATANDGALDIDIALALTQATDAIDQGLRNWDAGSTTNAGQQTTGAPTHTYQLPPQYQIPPTQPTPIPPQYSLQYAQAQHAGQRAAQSYSHTASPAPSQAQGSGSPAAAQADGQSQPTYRLYEAARQATNNRSSQPAPRKTGTQSQRRPWSTEEENALMQGLDQVKGPHWSMILQLYGAGGKINDVLKERNQVQLKDKARNLKLWFLKSNVEVPDSLKSVTGELKTRAPASVLRNSAANTAGPAAHLMQGQHMSPQGQGPHNYHSYASASPGVYAAVTPPVGMANSGYAMSGAQQNPTYGSEEQWYQSADDAAAQAAEDLQRLLGGDAGDALEGLGEPTPDLTAGDAAPATSVSEPQPPQSSEALPTPDVGSASPFEPKVEAAPDTQTQVAQDTPTAATAEGTNTAAIGEAGNDVEVPDFDEDALTRAAEEAAAMAAQDLAAL